MKETRYSIATNRKYNTAYRLAETMKGDVVYIDTTADVCIIHGKTEYNTTRFFVFRYTGSWWEQHGRAHYHKTGAEKHMFGIINNN